MDPRLGQLRRRIAVSAMHGWFVFSVGAALMVAWLGLSIAIVADRLSRGLSDAWFMPLMLALPFWPFAGIFMVRGWLGRQLSFSVYEGGVVLVDGWETEVLLWSDVQSILVQSHAHIAQLGFGLDVTTHHSAKLIFQAPFRPNLVLDERFPGHVDLVTFAHQAAVDAMLPRCLNALQSGQRVFFGAVGVDNWGLHLEGRAFPWEQVGVVRWEPRGHSDCFAVYDSAGTPLAEFDTYLPNRGVLEAALTQLGKLGDGTHRDAPRGDALLSAARGVLDGRGASMLAM